jgi:hypothetical protein
MKRECISEPVLHCAAGDSEITLRLFVAINVTGIAELQRGGDIRRDIKKNF